jgi:RNA-directed DNA polymerase
LNDSEVTVRKSSILKIEQSIEELFRTIKKENIEYLQWKLNLKITGFIIERHKYGWLFFYSQITDLSLLFHLDDVVQKLIKRYKLEGEIKVKRFVRTYAEMHMALHETKYIPNLDDLGLDDKKAILSDIYQIDLSDKDERFVEIQFHRIMKREIRDIEKDIENIS